jgi:hypothetical protein
LRLRTRVGRLPWGAAGALFLQAGPLLTACVWHHAKLWPAAMTLGVLALSVAMGGPAVMMTARPGGGEATWPLPASWQLLLQPQQQQQSPADTALPTSLGCGRRQLAVAATMLLGAAVLLAAHYVVPPPERKYRYRGPGLTEIYLYVFEHLYP